VSSEQRGTISIFDTATRRIVATVDLVAAFPDLETVQAVEMEATRDGKRAFVAMGRGDRVAEIDPATLKVVRSFPTGHRTWGIGLSPDEGRLYAASGLSGEVTIVDLADDRVSRTLKLGGKPWTAQAAPR
jgi:YVTN family beta-propeller protein